MKIKRKLFRCPKNNHGFIHYTTRSGKPMSAKTVKELYEKVLIPMCIENDKNLLSEIEGSK